MPSTSEKQHKFMEAVAHNPSFAKKVGVPQSVGQDFSKADKGKKFSTGGSMATSKLFKGKETFKEELNEAKAIKSGKISPFQYAKGEEGEIGRRNCRRDCRQSCRIRTLQERAAFCQRRGC